MLVEKGCSSHGEGGWCRRSWNRPQWWVLFWVGIATATANASTTTTNSVVGVIVVMITIFSCRHNREHHREPVHPCCFRSCHDQSLSLPSLWCCSPVASTSTAIGLLVPVPCPDHGGAVGCRRRGPRPPTPAWCISLQPTGLRVGPGRRPGPDPAPDLLVLACWSHGASGPLPPPSP